ncbi:MAG TPA: hypothetical protein VIL85_19925 [Thermomicrobiales bacterium]|jgi:hypothetical protein
MVTGATAIVALLLLGLLGGAALRRHRRAARGYAWFLGMRRYVLRGYARRRDGRIYDPARNPEAAHLGEPHAPTSDS